MNQHFMELRRELNPGKYPPVAVEQPSQPHIQPTKAAQSSSKASISLPKQTSMNDELFFTERKLEKEAIRDQIQRQQSLPSDHGDGKKTSLKESLFAAAQSTQLDAFREKFTKLRETRTERATAESSQETEPSSQNTSFTHGLVKILHRWKSEQETDNPEVQSSFTRKKGVNIDPIVVFGLRRDQSLDSATRRGLFHKKGAWSPKSPKVEAHSPLENPSLLSPTVRRCCMECPDENGVVERRLSRGETGSDGSKDSSIQSDTSLDSEDSCISVIFVPHPELKAKPEGTKQSPQSQRSTSNSSESSESPTGRGSPMSPGAKALSPNKIHAKGKLPKFSPSDCNLEKAEEDSILDSEEKEKESTLPRQSYKPKHFVASMLPRIPEHRSFELEDLHNETPINCHPFSMAERVEIMSASDTHFSPRPNQTSRFDYPIVKHHPLFAKTRKVRSSISSLLVGENIEFSRKQGKSSSQGVQSVRKTTPKLLTFEIYNPETDDLDSDTSVSSSPESEESVVSVITEANKATILLPAAEIKDTPRENCREITEELEIFRFEVNVHTESPPATQHVNSATKEMEKKEISLVYSSEELERKSEERKKCLISLLGENKSILQNINDSQIKCSDVEKVVLKTTSQLQSMEELRLPVLTRSETTSPDRKECKSEPINYLYKEIIQHGSLDSISSIPDQAKIDHQEELINLEDKPQQSVVNKVNNGDQDDAKICVDKSKFSCLVKMKETSKKVDDDVMPEIIISDASDNQNTDGTLLEPMSDNNNQAYLLKHKESDDGKCDNASAEMENDKVISESPSPKSLEEKISESSAKLDTDGQPIVPFRRMERKKREDSLDSNTPSVKSSIYHSDTGSVVSHRFSTVSISSNVSSDVSFGNNSGVSGSSCYLASMSSADFDDRPPLASSFSLSEAEENEYLSSQTNQDQETTKDEENSSNSTKNSQQVKKDQLSPPKPESKTQDRPKLKSLFKRSTDGKSKSSSYESKRSLQSSYESRSRDGMDESIGSKSRSRIGSSLTPDTSLDQNTCVERCSSSFEEELLRSFNKEDKDKDKGSETDSEDSAEAGGSLTHHRYYHVFREGEIDHIIEKYVENLHIISSYYDHANWCVVAEKVNVWTI